ncbi:MAG: hypothetical protein WC554_13970 [Clostridia bacterium]
MEKEKDVDSSKADFVIYASAKFQMPDNIKSLTQDLFENFIELMYDDLIKANIDKTKSSDSLGLWIEYDNKKYENAISLDTIDLIKKYSISDTKTISEFFKMTLKNNA